MADLATAFVRVRPNLTGFKAEAQAGTAKAGAALGKVFALAFGTVAVEELVRHVVTVAAQQDAMFAKVRQLTKSAGADWEVYGKTVQEAIIEKSEKSGFAVDQLANAYGRLIQQTKDSKEALRDVGIASDIARARGTAVTQVATSLSRALGGNAQALSRLGIIVPKYTAAQDAVKAKLAEVNAAEIAQKQAHDATLNGTIKLSAEAQRYAQLNGVQLAQLKLSLNAKLADAKASDKQVGAQKTLAEVASRFKGQGEIFGETAAGKADRFRISIHELEVTIGEQLIPLLAGAADQGRRWAQELEHSSATGETFRQIAVNIAHAVEQIAAAVGAALPAIQATATIVEDITSTVGAGPILAAWVAYQALGVAVAKYGKLVAAAKAEQVLLTERQAASVVATEAQAAATAQATEAQLALFSAQELEVGAQQSLFDATVADTLAIEANTVAKTENAAASAAAAGKVGLLSGAVSAFGPQIAVLGVAALAGGLYYLSTIASDTEKRLSSITKTLGDFSAQSKAAAASTVEEATTSRDAAQNAAVLARGALDAAKAKAAADEQAGSGLASYAADQQKVNDLTLAARQATDQYNAAQRNLDSTREAAHAARAQQAQDLRDAAKQLSDFAGTLSQVKAAGRSGLIIQTGQASEQVARFSTFIDDLVEKNHNLTAAQRLVFQSLQDDARAFGRIPSEKTILLRLNDKQFYERAKAAGQFLSGFLQPVEDALAKSSEGFAKGEFFKGAANPLASILNKPTPLLDPAGFQKAIGYTTQSSEKVKKGLTETVQAGITKGAQSSAADVAKAMHDALVQGVQDAKQNLTQIGDTLGGQIGQVIDANLALAEKKLANSPAARRIGELQAAISRESAERNARDQQAQTDSTLQQFQQLQAAFGPGAHTAEQDAQLTAAKNAYLDAQSSQREAADQIELDGLKKQQDQQKASLEKRAATQKEFAAKQIADLDDQLNRGLITEHQYVTRLQALLRKEGVNFKAAGKVLGIAFADGFQEQLTGILAQAKKIAELPAKVRGTGTGNAPTVIDPRAAAAKAGRDARGPADASIAVEKNTAEAVAELKKLGAKNVTHSGTTIHLTVPADATPKQRGDIAKLVKALTHK